MKFLQLQASTQLDTQAKPQQPPSQPQALFTRRRALLGAAAVTPLTLLLTSRGASAAGLDSSLSLPKLNLDSVPKPSLPSVPNPVAAAEEAFQNSPLLASLRDRTTSNKAKNKKDLEDKYCYRQAELGVGDCAGLRLIPGMTKSGAQKEKTWEAKLMERFFGDKE